MGSTKLTFGCLFTRKKSLFPSSGSFFYLTRTYKPLSTSPERLRASPLRNLSEYRKNNSKKILMKAHHYLSFSLPVLALCPFNFLHVSSQVQTFVLFFSPGELPFLSLLLQKGWGNAGIEITSWQAACFPTDQDSEGQGWDQNGFITGRGNTGRGEIKKTPGSLFGHSLFFACPQTDLSQIRVLVSSGMWKGVWQVYFLVNSVWVFMTQCAQRSLKMILYPLLWYKCKFS